MNEDADGHGESPELEDRERNTRLTYTVFPREATAKEIAETINAMLARRKYAEERPKPG